MAGGVRLRFSCDLDQAQAAVSRGRRAANLAERGHADAEAQRRVEHRLARHGLDASSVDERGSAHAGASASSSVSSGPGMPRPKPQRLAVLISASSSRIFPT